MLAVPCLVPVPSAAPPSIGEQLSLHASSGGDAVHARPACHRLHLWQGKRQILAGARPTRGRCDVGRWLCRYRAPQPAALGLCCPFPLACCDTTLRHASTARCMHAVLRHTSCFLLIENRVQARSSGAHMMTVPEDAQACSTPLTKGPHEHEAMQPMTPSEPVPAELIGLCLCRRACLHGLERCSVGSACPGLTRQHRKALQSRHTRECVLTNVHTWGERLTRRGSVGPLANGQVCVWDGSQSWSKRQSRCAR